jgi:hypothetical protein
VLLHLLSQAISSCCWSRSRSAVSS